MKTLKLRISTITKHDEELDNSWLEGKGPESVKTETSPASIEQAPVPTSETAGKCAVNLIQPTPNSHDSEAELKFRCTPNNQFLLIEKNTIRPIVDGEAIELGNFRLILNVEDVSERNSLNLRDQYFPVNDLVMIGNENLTVTEENDILTSAKVEVLEDPLIFLEKGQPLSDTWYHEVTEASYSDSTSHRENKSGKIF